MAGRAQVASVAFANFTWDWIYGEYAAFETHAPDVIPVFLVHEPGSDGSGAKGLGEASIMAIPAAIANAVAAATGVRPDEMPMTPEALGRDVRVTPQSGTTVLMVTVQSGQPGRARDIANKLVDTFILQTKDLQHFFLLG